MSCAALVLAAGLGSRFGGSKLLAPLDGRPLLQHVLDAVARVALSPVVVVLGNDAEQLEAQLSWRDEHRVRNPDPGRGLSSSVQLGLDALRQLGSAPVRVLVLLGDQPRVAGQQLDVLLAQPADAERPFVVPRYADGQPGNPVLLEPAGWPLVERLTGDRGTAQLFAGDRQLVRYVDVLGSNPDVDTVEDLARLSRAAGPARSSRTAGADRSRP